MKRALIAGFFSTIGDVESLEVVQDWLEVEGVAYDVGAYSRKVRKAFGFVDPRRVDPSRYTHLIIVCGPFHQGFYRRIGFDIYRFSRCVRIGINLEIYDSPADLPFDVLIERSSRDFGRPDLSFLKNVPPRPVVGILLAPVQREYGKRQRHRVTNAAISEALRDLDVAVIELDTRVPESRNKAGLRTASEFESVCARLDCIVTTRLHGLVLGIKNGVPVVAVDPIAGGAKIAHQAELLGWPHHLGEREDVEAIRSAIIESLTPDARRRAVHVAKTAVAKLDDTQIAFFSALATSPSGKRTRRGLTSYLWRLALRSE